MNRTTEYCTRVSAPASRDPDLNPILNDENPLNPDGRAFPDRGESGSKVPRLLKCPSIACFPHVESEAQHVCFHIALSCATWCASLQPFHPNLVIISSSTVRLQVSFRLPFFLLPSGFQVNATLIWLLNSLLNICSIYLQRLSRVASLTVLVLLRRYSSSIEIFIGHLILTIFFMNIRWNLSSLSPSVPVILHRSAPYSRTGITLLWNKRSFVFRRYDSDFHTFQRILKEFLAFESLSMLSASAPPSSIAVDPR